MRTKFVILQTQACIICRPLVLFCCSLFFLQSLFAQQPKYNVLFIAVDDMNDRLSFLGNPEVHTPNLQRLVNHGMLFTKAYTQFALCNPSRTSILSGWRPDHTQIFANDVRPGTVMGNNVVHLPELFHMYGYHTERYGKIAHDLFESDVNWDYAEPGDRVGGDESIMSNLNIMPAGATAYTGADWWIRDIPDSATDDGTIARHLLARMRQPQIFPFFYGLGFHSPHNPFNPSLQYWNMNGDPGTQELLQISNSGTLSSKISGNSSSNILLPNTPLNDRADIPGIAFNGKRKLLADTSWRRVVHAYDAEVAEWDAQLGLVLDELDRQNLWSNTVVVFWSDHGQHLGEHEGQWLKLTLFEESVHIPLIVCAPGKKPGICTKLVELVDLYPTLAELCGLPAPQGLEGSSFVRLLDNPDQAWKRAAFSQVTRSGISMGRSVRTEQYRYTSWAASGEELYDHDADPHEYTNLASKPEYASILDNMRQISKEGWTQSLPPACIDKICYRDKDEDGYGSVTDSIFACVLPAGYVVTSGDCNDADSSIHPGAVEKCNNVDDNCNGQIDEDVVPDKIFYGDNDGDGYGNAHVSVVACTAPEGFVTVSGDCDDSNAAVHPGAAEIINGIDDNCDGVVDEATVCYADIDHDGYGDALSFIVSVSIPTGYVDNALDCDDQDPLKNPAAAEILNDIDDNCNGLVDEGLDSVITYYRDLDGDGFGDAAKSIAAVAAPPGYVTNNGDCNDANPFMNPSALDLCNGIDDNCNGIIDENSFSAGISAFPTYSFCTGGSGILKGTSSSANVLTYQWYKNGLVVTGGTGPQLAISTAGSYYVIESDKLYCSSNSSATKVSLWPLPSATITYAGSLDICITGSVVFSANSGSGFSYQWLKNGVSIAGATKKQYTAVAAGAYAVKVYNANGCSRTSLITNVTNSCGTVPLYNGSDPDLIDAGGRLFLYPNPSAGKVKLDYRSGEPGKLQIVLYDIAGKKVFQQKVQAAIGKNIFDLDLSLLSPGIYHLQLTGYNTSINTKVTIVR